MKTITSPVEKYPGQVVLYDPIPFERVFKWETALRSLSGGELSLSNENVAALLPGIIACVSEWHLDGFPEPVTVETWPGTPKLPALQVVLWLVGEISEIVTGGVSPNE